MVRDRTGDLKKILNGQGSNLLEENIETAIEMEPKLTDSPFFAQVESIRGLIENIRNDSYDLRKKQSKILTTPVVSQEDKDELERYMSSIRAYANDVKKGLKEMENYIKKEEENSAGFRAKKSQHAFLLNSFIDVMNAYQLGQAEYRDKCKNTIKRQIEITGANMQDEEIEEMIENGNFNGIFTQGLLEETERAKKVLAEVESRHEEITKLERSLRELHTMFIELNELVYMQGERVDTIENHVNSTQSWVEDGNKQLVNAKMKQTSARKKCICIGVTLTIIAIIVIIIIVVSLI